MKLAALIPMCVALVACQTVSEVIPAGKDTYMIGATARGGLESHAEVTAMSIKRGTEYCAAKGQRFEIVSAANTGTRGWTELQSQVMFKCVEK